jgi:hypothetical protein
VPAGASFTLMLHDQAATGTLKLRLETAGQSWEGALPLATLAHRLRIAWEGGRWQPGSHETREAGWTGAEIRSQGSLKPVRTNEEELRKGLRALGYIR